MQKPELISLIKKYNLRVKKSLGQNFLIDDKILAEIISASKLSKADAVLEIGPGLGTLTEGLCQKAKKIYAIEKDDKLFGFLQENLKCSNLKLIKGDILKYDISKLKLKSYKLIANLPYNITAPVLRKFLTAKSKPSIMILMLQKEVAEKITNKKKMSILSLSVLFYGEPEILKIVSKDSFWPKPKVDSAIIAIKTRDKPIYDLNEDLFFKIVKAGFSEKRKKVKNSLVRNLSIKKEIIEEMFRKARIDPNKRAEDLSLSDWGKLYQYVQFTKQT